MVCVLVVHQMALTGISWHNKSSTKWKQSYNMELIIYLIVQFTIKVLTFENSQFTDLTLVDLILWPYRKALAISAIAQLEIVYTSTQTLKINSIGFVKTQQARRHIISHYNKPNTWLMQYEKDATTTSSTAVDSKILVHRWTNRRLSGKKNF